jgi:DNA-binding IscR family transcriptional regulator
MHEPVSPALRVFLLEHIDSVAQLEALLLLRREGKSLPVAAIAGALYVPETVAADELAALRQRGLLAVEEGREPAYRFAPAEPETVAMVDLLAATYARALIPVTNIVHGNPLRLRRFADAFRFRKDK